MQQFQECVPFHLFLINITPNNVKRSSPFSNNVQVIHRPEWLPCRLNLCSLSGVKSIATPGELRGYWEAKQLYGNKSITWESLIQPTIAMCYNGIKVNWHLAKSLKKTEDVILKDSGMRQVDNKAHFDEYYYQMNLTTLGVFSSTRRRAKSCRRATYTRETTFAKLSIKLQRTVRMNSTLERRQRNLSQNSQRQEE